MKKIKKIKVPKAPHGRDYEEEMLEEKVSPGIHKKILKIKKDKKGR